MIDSIVNYIITENLEAYFLLAKEGIIMDSVQNILRIFTQGVKNVLGANLQKIIVYGSYARGDYNENSDIDIMVLTSLSDDKIEPVEDMLYDIAFDILMDYGIQISVIVKNEDHFRYWLGALPFYDNVEREGVEFVG